jgi:alkanesulfonate monooxygenase SsuD/methylene tetrahydromethanopterin reductase-like flavin-dependent oxidoreductase (luciferase family)
MPDLGFVVRPEPPPEALPDLARRVEAAGFDELWLWEDCFWAGGIAATAAALAATSHIRVGLGIMPTPVRNAAFAAMEIAALARLHPGRVLPGFGHGVTAWMRQIGAKPESQVGLLEEIVAAVRALLAGEEVRVDGRYVRLDGVRLDHPPAEPPPVYVGVRRERSLAASGRVADGTILSEPSSVEYVGWALEQIAATRPHRLTVYAWCSMDADPSAARAALRPLLAERLREGGPQMEAIGIAEAVAAHAGDADDAWVQDDWIDRLTVCGTPDQCAASIRALAEAGADAVVLVPPSPSVAPEALARELVARPAP